MLEQEKLKKYRKRMVDLKKPSPFFGEGFAMLTQQQEKFTKGSKLAKSENPWYNIFRKKERQQARDFLKKRRPPRIRQMATI
jgi:hypothetical protein